MGKTVLLNLNPNPVFELEHYHGALPLEGNLLWDSTTDDVHIGNSDFHTTDGGLKKWVNLYKNKKHVLSIGLYASILENHKA